MKGYLLFDNEETRENFLPMVWETVKCSGNEIEIPNKQFELACGFEFVRIYGCRSSYTELLSSILIPRPKVKVKKTVEVSLFNDATAKWRVPLDMDTSSLPKYLGTFPVEIEVEE